jgi:hypothetical protein
MTEVSIENGGFAEAGLYLLPDDPNDREILARRIVAETLIADR